MPMSGIMNVKEFTFKASLPIETSRNESYVLELHNLDMESFDSMTKQKRSIIGVIPLNDINERVNYEAQYPRYINLNNKETMYLRNLNLRILNKELEPVDLTGNTQLVLSIEDDK